MVLKPQQIFFKNFAAFTAFTDLKTTKIDPERISHLWNHISRLAVEAKWQLRFENPKMYRFTRRNIHENKQKSTCTSVGLSTISKHIIPKITDMPYLWTSQPTLTALRDIATNNIILTWHQRKLNKPSRAHTILFIVYKWEVDNISIDMA